MKDSTRRALRYLKKVSGDVSKDRSERYRKQQASQYTDAIGKQVEIERKVKQILEAHGCSVILIPYYIIFGKKLAKLSKKYQGTVFATEACIEANKWVQRDLDEFILEDILYQYGVICVALQELKFGMILMWHGTIATIPAGWSLCDGNNGTPDLRDRFVAGARQDDAGVAKTNLTGALTVSGGSIAHAHTLTMDGHSHSFTGNGHSHSFTGYGHNHYIDQCYEVQSGSGAEVAACYSYTQDNYATGETDSTYVDGTTGMYADTGHADSIDAPQPYYALAFIMKL